MAEVMGPHLMLCYEALTYNWADWLAVLCRLSPCATPWRLPEERLVGAQDSFPSWDFHQTVTLVIIPAVLL